MPHIPNLPLVSQDEKGYIYFFFNCVLPVDHLLFAGTIPFWDIDPNDQQHEA